MALLAIVFTAACGGVPPAGSGDVPVLLSVAPAAAGPGDDVTVTGAGFSQIPQDNWVVVGSQVVLARNFEVTDDGQERLTFTLPADVQAGEGDLLVLSDQVPSNSLSFTVEP